MGIRMSEAFPSKFLRAADLQGRTIKVTINLVQMEDVGTEDKPEHKPVAYFQNKDKGLVLNKTNGATIAMAYGDDTDGWGGADIELFPQAVPFNGQMVPAIRVRVPAAEDAAPPPVQRNITPNARNRPVQQYDERNPPPRSQMHIDMDDEIPFSPEFR